MNDKELLDLLDRLHDDSRRYQLEHSDEVLVNVHLEEDCESPCCIHSKSDHSMRSFPQHWRGDRGIMERLNPFGGACPDPDNNWPKGSAEWVHGCIVNPAYPVGMCSPWYINGVEAAWIDRSYAVTKDGKVWSFLQKLGPKNNNKCISDYSKPPKELKQRDNGKGYKTVVFGRGGKTQYVHRLVLSAWRGAAPGGMDCRHLNGIRSDNRLENLAWGTRKDQENDQLLHGTKPTGETHPNSRLTLAEVSEARKQWAQGSTLPEIINSLHLTVSKATLHDALTGKTWKHCLEPAMKKQSPMAVVQKEERIARLEKELGIGQYE